MFRTSLVMILVSTISLAILVFSNSKDCFVVASENNAQHTAHSKEPDPNTKTTTVRCDAWSPDCGTLSREQVLIEDQKQILAKFGSLTTIKEIAKAGYVPTHGFISYQECGVAFGKPDRNPSPGCPNLLVFAPNPNASSAQVMDKRPDEPYRLVGWAYGFNFVPNNPPTPHLCMPPEEWFLHEAGYHQLKGEFLATPPAETTPCSVDVNWKDFPRDNREKKGLWHPRVWDIHFWRNDAGAPKLGILNPSKEPSIGKVFKARTFFYCK